MFDTTIPAYYVLPRSIEDKDLAPVLNVLSFTPVICTVIDNTDDYALAAKFSREIIQSKSPESAREVASLIHADTSRAVLVIGDADTLTPVFEDK